jgi:hypothetical protein
MGILQSHAGGRLSVSETLTEATETVALPLGRDFAATVLFKML